MAVTHLKNKGSKTRKLLPSFESGGKVEKEFETIHSSDGSKTLIRKGFDPETINAGHLDGKRGTNEKGARAVGTIRAERFIADTNRKFKYKGPTTARYDARYEDED